MFVILKNSLVLQIREISAGLTLGLLDLCRFSAANGLLSKREVEKQGAVYALRGLLNTNDISTDYTPFGKPFVKGRPEHISVSHSHDMLAVTVNKNEPTGVDIELLRDKVLTVRHKFLNELETRTAGNDVLKLMTIWAAKEALYKVYGLKKVDFKSNLSVELKSGNSISGTIHIGDLKKSYLLHSEKLGNYILVYTCNEI
jgi:4'-phosphopantetheinyl transferase